MKRKQNTKALARGRSSAKTARGSRKTGGSTVKMGARSTTARTKSAGRSKSAGRAKPASRAGSRTGVSSARARSGAKSGAKRTIGAKAGAKSRSVSTRSRASSAAGARNKRSSSGRGLVKAVSRIKGKTPLKSTSEMRAKRASGRKSMKTAPNQLSGARRTTSRQPLGTSRRVNGSTKPSFGEIAISDIQRSSVESRVSPNSERPFTGSDAFKPDAKGAQDMTSAPPRKPIRQSRDQVGVRHH